MVSCIDGRSHFDAPTLLWYTGVAACRHRRLPDQFDGVLDLPLIGISASTDTGTLCALKITSTSRGSPKPAIDRLTISTSELPVGAVFVKAFDHVNTRIPTSGMETPIQSFKLLPVVVLECGYNAQHQVAGACSSIWYRLAGERVPVTHRDGHVRPIFAQFRLEGRRLPAGYSRDRTPATDFRVVICTCLACVEAIIHANGWRAIRANGEIDDVRIAEQVVQERPDALQGIRAAELKENDPKLHNLRVYS